MYKNGFHPSNFCIADALLIVLRRLSPREASVGLTVAFAGRRTCNHCLIWPLQKFLREAWRALKSVKRRGVPTRVEDEAVCNRRRAS